MNFIFDYLKKLKGNPLVTGSLIMFIGTNTHNIGQLIYHYLAINLLSKAHYGDLAALVSIFGLLAIVQQSLGIAVVKFIASSKDEAKANNFARWVFYWGIRIAILLAAIILVTAGFLSDFLHISQPIAVYLFAPAVAIGFISNTGRALLVGFVKFTKLSASLVTEVTVKIIMTTALLYYGYQLFGAVIGLFIGLSVGFLFVWLSIKGRIKGERKRLPEVGSLFKFTLPVLVQSIAFTSMVSTDLLLVKYFFVPDVAGAYAALAKFGTIALFAASPITQVMFPLIAKRHSHGQPYHKVFYLSLFLITLVSSFIVLIYLFFGNVIADILTAGKYKQESYLLWRLSFYMLLLGIALLFTQFYLSIGQTKVVWLFVLSALLQILLIVLFHTSLLDVVNVSIISAALLVVSLSIYFPYHDSK